ncbi:MAG: hypothetical protein J5937_00495 [Paludibacteraceae bacterium]|nr:hypothetical protein [Paludibacteraceae bacterium]
MKKIFIILMAAMVAAGSVYAADNKKASKAKANTKTTVKANTKTTAKSNTKTTAKANTKTTAKAAPKSDKEYTHSVGVVAGSGIGFQYKKMVSPHFTLIEEFGYLGSWAAAGDGFSTPAFGAVDNLVLAYQAKCAEGQGIRLDYYVGGQIKGGYIDMGAAGGIVGAGAAAGIEGKMKNAPIAFSFDFRPGYGCLLGDDGTGNIGAFHVFDWTLNLGVRYTF